MFNNNSLPSNLDESYLQIESELASYVTDLTVGYMVSYGHDNEDCIKRAEKGKDLIGFMEHQIKVLEELPHMPEVKG